MLKHMTGLLDFRTSGLPDFWTSGLLDFHRANLPSFSQSFIVYICVNITVQGILQIVPALEAGKEGQTVLRRH